MINDPNARREAEKYDTPVASREFLLELLNTQSVPISHEQVVEQLGYQDEERIEAVRRRLNAMVRDGQIFRNRRGGFLSFEHMDLAKGRVQAHADGFGFLIPDDGQKDIFLPAREMKTLMNGDRVAVKISGFDTRRERKEGYVVAVLERAHQSVVGRYYREKGIHLVIPDDKRLHDDILLSSDFDHSARQGDIVVVRILEYPDQHNPAIGMIETVLGKDNAPGIEVTIAINSHHIPHQWSEEVVAAAHQVPAEVAEADKQGRLDLRHLPFVTIDGETARDFDDAVYCESLENGYRLWVAIADVSHYVAKGSAIDLEAEQRGTSVYFPGEVIPMLPEVLSNGLCSLNPKVDRLVMVCEMEIGPAGAIRAHRFHEGLIHSHARLTYTQVQQFLFESQPVAECANVAGALNDLNQVYRALSRARKSRHAIEFETSEVVFEYNDQRKIENIHPYQREESHRIIEECMIAANICAARFLKKSKLPTLYRIHEGPNPDKLQALSEFLSVYGVRLTGTEPTPKHYAEALKQVRDLPEFGMIQTVMLRSLLQAHYGPDEKAGHFGLALKDYAHFTSPIRRYPDLLVHRGIRHLLRGGKREDFGYDQNAMLALGESCSSFERRADEATRDAEDWLKCDYLQKHIGLQSEGIVTSVTGFGMFVQLNDLLIEGLVHVTSLKRDYYHFDPVHHRLVGEQSGRVYQLGDRLVVEVVRVDMEERKIDFNLIESREERFLSELPNKKPQRNKPRNNSSRKTHQQSGQPGSDNNKKGKGKKRQGKKRPRKKTK